METKQQRINDLAWDLAEKVLRDYHYPEVEDLEHLLQYAHQVYSEKKDIEFKL